MLVFAFEGTEAETVPRFLLFLLMMLVLLMADDTMMLMKRTTRDLLS